MSSYGQKFISSSDLKGKAPDLDANSMNQFTYKVTSWPAENKLA